MDADLKFKLYLLRELEWELKQHPHLLSPFTNVPREEVEVLSYRGYDTMLVRVGDATYEVQLSWRLSEAPTISRAKDRDEQEGRFRSPTSKSRNPSNASSKSPPLSTVAT